MTPDPSQPISVSFAHHLPGAPRAQGYMPPIDMARIGRTKADEALIRDPAGFRPKHFLWELRSDGVAVITLNRPEKKNPLTFDSYAELRDTMQGLAHAPTIRAVVIRGAGGNFCTGGDVIEIIEPLIRMDYHDRLAFTQMTGDLIIAMRAAPQPIIAAVEGACFGAGAAIAMAADACYGTPHAKIGFIFSKVGLGGCDMGACSLLPKIIGERRAREILLWSKPMGGSDALAYGFFNGLADNGATLTELVNTQLGRLLKLAPRGLTLTKRALSQEACAEEAAHIRLEAELQARAMADPDFGEYCRSFMARRAAQFTGAAPADELLSADAAFTPLPKITLPGWKATGYSHAADCSTRTMRWLKGGGMTGMDENERIVEPWGPGGIRTQVLVQQATRAMNNIAAVIRHAGEHPNNIANLRFFVTEEFMSTFREPTVLKEFGKAYRAAFGKNFPGESLFGVSRLFDPAAVIEIEWELVRPY